MSTLIDRRLFTPVDILFWGLFLGSCTGFAIAAAVTRQDPPVPLQGWVILWAAVLAMWGIAAAFFVRRARFLKTLRFVLEPGVVFGWDSNQYRISEDAARLEVDDLLAKMTPSYPNAAAALAGCLVWVREPTWNQDGTVAFAARTVAGVQDGQLLLVGWREDLKTSALKHELAHRVLQVCAGDPHEAVAHELLAKLGL